MLIKLTNKYFYKINQIEFSFKVILETSHNLEKSNARLRKYLFALNDLNILYDSKIPPVSVPQKLSFFLKKKLMLNFSQDKISKFFLLVKLSCTHK